MTEPVSTVAAVVVTHNSASFIATALTSIAPAFSAGEIVSVTVVDNGSTDDTVQVVRTVLPSARVIERPDNPGYAAAINAAIDSSTADAVLVLNPDTELSAGAGTALLAALSTPVANGAVVGITVPRMRELDGSVAPTLRRTPTLMRAIGEALLGGGRAGRVARLGEVVPVGPVYDQLTVADWATGACWMISRACADAVGRWDERFWLYSEETDYALRARDVGFRLVHVPTAELMHRGGESNSNPRLWTVLTTNRVRSYAKRHTRWATAAFWAAVVINEGLRARTHATHRAALVALARGPAALSATYESVRGPRPVRRSNTDT